jgi:hypothetical protein
MMKSSRYSINTAPMKATSGAMESRERALSM